MTMRTCGRVVLGIGAADGAVNSTAAASRRDNWTFIVADPCLQIAADAQPLERILGLMVERAAGALGHLGVLELGQDFVDVGGKRGDREGDVLVTKRTVALAVLRQIERDNRDVFALRVG